MTTSQLTRPLRSSTNSDKLSKSHMEWGFFAPKLRALHIPHLLGWRFTYFPRGIFRTPKHPSRVMLLSHERRYPQPSPLESGMGLVLPAIEAYHVQHLPI